jgi:osmoprotectant transport system substrate-binding protein
MVPSWTLRAGDFGAELTAGGTVTRTDTAARPAGSEGRGRMRFSTRLGAALAVVAASAVVVTACGSSGGSGSSGGGGATAAANKGTVTVGSANFSESTLIANMYADVLKKAGYTVKTKYNLGSRELYLKSLGNGEIDVVPEYLSTLTTFLVDEDNPNATSPASGDAAKTLAALQPVAAAKGFTAYPYSPAADQNAFAVSQATATKYHLTKLSDLANPDVAGKLTIGGPPECQTRAYCEPGLEKTYGAKFAGFKALDAGGPLTINAIADGSVGIGLVFSSDGVVASKNLVVLEDDKHLQSADNVLPLVRSSVATADLKTTLDSVDKVLTTDDLKQMNKQIGVDKDDPSDVAEQYLKSKGLI